MVAHAYNLSTWKAEARRTNSKPPQGQSELDKIKTPGTMKTKEPRLTDKMLKTKCVEQLSTVILSTLRRWKNLRVQVQPTLSNSNYVITMQFNDYR